MQAFDVAWSVLKNELAEENEAADLERGIGGRPLSRWEERHAPLTNEGPFPEGFTIDPPIKDLRVPEEGWRSMLGPKRSRTHRFNQLNALKERGIPPTPSEQNLSMGRGTTYPDEPQTAMEQNLSIFLEEEEKKRAEEEAAAEAAKQSE